MTKTHTTRKALLMSILSLMLCFSMLIGTTFAWFTDTVTSAGNIIKTGKLDVELHWADGAKAVPTAEADWADASTGAIFDYANWEPGYVQVRHIRIANKGTLAFKYKVSIIANGEVSDLSDVIDVYYVDPAVQVVDRAALANLPKLGTLTDVLAKLGETGNGTLEMGKSDVITIAFKMQETAGNEYQEKSIGSDFSVQLLATQLAFEGDSFDNKYDVDASYVAEVKTADDLAAALKAGGLVRLANDISATEAMTVPAGVTVELDLNGKTITGTKGRDADNNRIHVLVNNGILTINGGTVKSGGNDGGSAIYNNAGASLIINDVTLYGAPQSDPVYEVGVSKPYPSYALNNYGTAVINGATIKSYHGAVATGDNGSTVINDADIDVGLGQSTGITSYLIYSFGDAQVTVNGGNFAFTKQEVYVNGGNTFCELGTNPIIVNGGNYIGTSFSTGADREYVINGGTFDKDPTAYVADGYQVVDNGNGTYTVSYDGTVASTADELTAAFANGGTVLLADDIDLASSVTVAAGKSIELDLNGKTISAPNGYAFTNKGTLTIIGDSVVEGKNYAIKNSGGTVTLKGGSYKGSSGAIFNSAGMDAVIVDGDVYDSDFYAVTVKGGNIENCEFDAFEIYGGTFENCTFTSNGAYAGGTFEFVPPASSLLPNYVVVDNADGTYTVVPDYEAYIGAVGYLTFYDMLNEVQDGDVVTVAKDIDFLGGYEIYNKNITIDLNGKTLTAGKDYPSACINGITEGYVFKVTGTSNVTFKNGTLSGPYGKVCSDGTATFTLDGVN